MGLGRLPQPSRKRRRSPITRMRGAKARTMLAKLSSIDLHPDAFPVGAAAATSMDHTSVTLWRGKDRDGLAVFNVLVFATFAESLWHTMLDSAAEFGVAIGHSEEL